MAVQEKMEKTIFLKLKQNKKEIFKYKKKENCDTD